MADLTPRFAPRFASVAGGRETLELLEPVEDDGELPRGGLDLLHHQEALAVVGDVVPGGGQAVGDRGADLDRFAPGERGARLREGAKGVGNLTQAPACRSGSRATRVAAKPVLPSPRCGESRLGRSLALAVL